MNIKYKSKMSWTFDRKRAIMKSSITSDIILLGMYIYGINTRGFRTRDETKKINKKERKIAKEF